ncbi:carboxypeptidase-like regulatory domain-containing protein [Rufibacter roseus]|uniref:Carboxypeptidase-like regulatory domain-containing protein n=1 Tax=Rufibacter roseus TaxID=1567108 RepID=A0ABW2DFT8_9BACT|nr:carboxypeptidase-like regulatory domain-containing protein [Rufibacter roseus]
MRFCSCLPLLRFFFLLYVISLVSGKQTQAQTTGYGGVSGTVIDAQTGQPLGFATVFIAQTTYGTNAEENGTFKLPALPAGSHELVVSFLGYETLTHHFKIEDGQQLRFRLQLTPKANALQEVVIRPDTNWRHNYEVFLKSFIGQTPNAAQTKIINPEVLHFNFDPQANVLTADASEPLVIESKALGYRLHFLLETFEADFKSKRVFHAGYPRYEELKSRSKAQRNRWEKARLKAYNGSLMHFARALRAQSLEQEGFNVRRLQRLPNPHRPAEEDIQRGLKTWRGKSNTIVIGGNGVKDDSLQYWLRMSRLSRTVEYLHKDPVPYDQLVQPDSVTNMLRLQFSDFLNVVYVHEFEEEAFLRQQPFSKPRDPTYQTSVLGLTQPYTFLDPSGMIVDPNSHLVEGYWAWEKLAEMLPLDYQPPLSEK